MRYYPENLKSQASVWLWKVRDLIVTGTLITLGLFAFSATGEALFAMIGVAYGILTAQAEEVTVMDFIVWAAGYFLVEQQHYEWRMRDET